MPLSTITPSLAILVSIIALALWVLLLFRKKNSSRLQKIKPLQEPSLNLYETWENVDVVVKNNVAELKEQNAAETFESLSRRDSEDSDVVLGLKQPQQIKLDIGSPSEVSKKNRKVEKNSPNKSSKIIIFYVMATEGRSYAGYELLQALLAVGFRYGKMNIFHCHEFSLASAMEPGTFELSKMGGFSTPGLILFMDLSKVSEPLPAFELMIETTHQLVDDLGGEALDEKRRPLIAERIIELRKQISGRLRIED